MQVEIMFCCPHTKETFVDTNQVENLRGAVELAEDFCKEMYHRTGKDWIVNYIEPIF